MRYDQLYQTHLYQFDSLEDLLTNVEKAWKNAARYPLVHFTNIEFYGNARWMGRYVSDVSHAVRLSKETWDEGMRNAEELLNKVRDHHIERPVSIKRTPKWSEDGGDELDIDRLRSGVPYWRTTERVYRPAQTHIAIVADNSAPQNQNATAMSWRGTAAIILAELLEAAGYRTEIYSAYFGENTYNDKHHYAQILNLKHSEDMIDRSTLVNVLSGWFFRSICIQAATLRGGQYLHKDQFGYATSLDGWIQPKINRPGAVVANSLIYNEESAIKWITKSLETLTKPPKPPEPPKNDVPKEDYVAKPVKPLTREEIRQQEKAMEAWRKARQF